MLGMLGTDRFLVLAATREHHSRWCLYYGKWWQDTYSSRVCAGILYTQVNVSANTMRMSWQNHTESSSAWESQQELCTALGNVPMTVLMPSGQTTKQGNTSVVQNQVTTIAEAGFDPAIGSKFSNETMYRSSSYELSTHLLQVFPRHWPGVWWHRPQWVVHAWWPWIPSTPQRGRQSFKFRSKGLPCFLLYSSWRSLAVYSHATKMYS